MKQLVSFGKIAACAAMCGMLSAEAALPKVVVTDTVRDAEGHPTAVTVAFQDFNAGKSYPLYLFCGADDAGNDTNAWAYVERLDDIAPGETSRTIQPPECYCREYYTIRFAANCPIAGTPDTGSYVQDDLEVMWDAIENAAPGVHDATTNVWTDLTGNGFDWNINLNNASWTDDGLVINPTGTAGTIRNGKQPADLYQKVKTLEFVYENADNTRAGILLGFGFGRTAYLYTANNGHVGYYDYKGQAVAENKTYCYSVAYTAASETANMPNGVANCWLNGQVDLDDGMNDYWGPAGSIVLNGRNGTPYAKGTLRAVRIYSRVLTDDERMENFVCDSARFFGATDFFAFSECVKDTPVWLYDATAKTITNAKTGWKITVSASGRSLTLGARDASGAADPATLDLTGLVADANVNVYSITTIPGSWIKSDATITDITLPLTLKSIGGEAFYGCAVERIGNFLPPGLTSLGSDAFNGCTKLASPLVMGDLCVGGGNWRFCNCRALPSAVIGASFTKLENNDFVNCFALTNVVLPNTLTSIGASAFAGCTALRRIEPFLPASVTYVGSDAFSGCTALESPLALGQEKPVTLASNYDFYNCQKIPSITIGQLASSIPEYCFYNCTSVRTFYLPDAPFTQSGGRWPFTGWTAYQSRWIMPKDSEVWMNIATNSTDVTALTPEEQATYDSLFSDSYDCVGTIAGNFHCAKQWLVKPSDHEKFYAMLEVVGGPTGYAADKVVPTYGNLNATDLLPLDCSAPEYHAEPSVLWRCTGYVLEKKLDETHYELVEDGAGELSFTFNPTEAGNYRITWNWAEGGYRAEIPAFFGESVFEVTTDVAPTAEGFYPTGTEVAYTARATGDAPFVRWYGDIGTNDPASATISILIDGSKRLMPYFGTPWRLSADKKSITDGYWSNSVSVAANGGVTLNGRIVPQLTGFLDLTKPIEGEGYTFVGIGSDVFSCGNPEPEAAYRSALALFTQWGDFRVKLPETLRSIGKNAFRHNRALVTVEPLLPRAVTFFGENAFYGCSALTGDLVLDPEGPVTIEKNWQFCGCSHITSAFLNERFTVLPESFFSGCSSMTNVILRGRITNIEGYVFNGCASLRRIEPCCLPATVTHVGDFAFNGCSVLENEISIGWAKNTTVTFDSNKNFGNCPKITSAQIGPAVQNLQKTVFWQSKGVKDVWIGGEYPNFIGNDSMGWNAYQARIHLPRGVASVEDYIASSVTPWTNLSGSVQAVYTNAYPGARLPIGLTKDAVWPNQWAVRWSSPWLGVGTKLIVR